MRSASAAPSAPAPAPADLGPAEPARTGATRAWLCAAGAALCLSVAAPGAVRGAEALVVVGLALLYRVVTGGRGSALRAYLVGVAYLAAVSWSLRHIVFAAYVAIALLGGVYFAILPRWVRGLGALRVPGPLAFGLAVAGAAWLRAYMPEITYPHAQPAHALFRWPALLYGPVALGGEELANVLLAACAAAAAAGAWRRRAAWLAGLALGWGGAHVAAGAFAGSASADATLDVAAIQPGLTPDDLLLQEANALRARQRETLVRPTLAVAARGDVPDLVLWPESTAFVELLVDAVGHRQLARASWWCTEAPLPLAPGVRLLVGGLVSGPVVDGTAVGLLLDHRGALVDHHEKLRLVPGGERQPFLGWLPEAWSRALQASLAGALGSAPHLVPGSFRPPLQVAEGVRAGVLLCFDNAFGDVARRHVEAGANLLVVLSNECWYRGGAELDQLEAMSVFRTLETGVPMVRCTVDGITVALDGEGRTLGRLPRGAPGTLRIRVPVPRHGRPVAPAAPLTAALSAGSLLLALAQGLYAWARLRRSRRSEPERRGLDMPVAGA